MINRLSITALLLPCTLASDTPSLAEAAKGLGVYIGSAVGIPHLGDNIYDKLEIQNYNLITAENACKMYSIARSETNFDSSDCNQLRDLAKSNN
jgi:GH35 family endo-1,4-beta-xylanase